MKKWSSRLWIKQNDSHSLHKDHTAYFLLTTYVRKENTRSKNRIFIVHRLDRDTSGILVFAKNEQAKRCLQEEWHAFKKKYYAVVHGTLPQKEGVIISYLAEGSVYKMVSVDDPEKGKLAKTGYRVLRESKRYSLLEIDLFTGLKGRIRFAKLPTKILDILYSALYQRFWPFFFQ